MKAQAIQVGALETRTIQGLAEWAAKSWHWIRHETPWPADNPLYVILVGSIRCVFAIVERNDVPFRRLTCESRGKTPPSPAAVWTLATHFGFTGGGWRTKGEDWTTAIEGKTISLEQPL